MNYLKLCQTVVEKADIPGVGPSSVLNQTGMLRRIVGWVSEAWNEILRDQVWWTFRLNNGSADIVVNVREYVKKTFLPADFDIFWPKSIYLKDGNNVVGRLTNISWEAYTDQFLHSKQNTAVPTEFAISPNGRVMFNTVPDKNYKMVFDYQMRNKPLVNNNDVPILPEDFHDLIWQSALKKYGEHVGAPEVYQPASAYLMDWTQELQNRYLPKVRFRGNVYDGYQST